MPSMTKPTTPLKTTEKIATIANEHSGLIGDSSSSKSSFDDSKFDDVPELELKNDQTLTIKSFQHSFSLSRTNEVENSYAEIPIDQSTNEEYNEYNTVPYESDDDLDINAENIKPVADNDSEFQKFMQADGNDG